MLQRGFWQVTRLGGAPLRLHWTMPLGALVFGGLDPVRWLMFFVTVLGHELGHAAFVRFYRLRVVSIDITGFGGLCRWTGSPTRAQRGVIAWGGVLAQAAMILAALPFVVLSGTLGLPGAALLATSFIVTNLLIIALNLLPFPPLDGAEAWGVVWERLRSLRPRWPRPGRLRWWVSRREQAEGQRLLDELRGAKPSSPAQQRAERAGSPERAREVAQVLEQLSREAGRARRGERG